MITHPGAIFHRQKSWYTLRHRHIWEWGIHHATNRTLLRGRRLPDGGFLCHHGRSAAGGRRGPRRPGRDGLLPRGGRPARRPRLSHPAGRDGPCRHRRPRKGGGDLAHGGAPFPRRRPRRAGGGVHRLGLAVRQDAAAHRRAHPVRDAAPAVRGRERGLSHRRRGGADGHQRPHQPRAAAPGRDRGQPLRLAGPAGRGQLPLPGGAGPDDLPQQKGDRGPGADRRHPGGGRLRLLRHPRRLHRAGRADQDRLGRAL